MDRVLKLIMAVGGLALIAAVVALILHPGHGHIPGKSSAAPPPRPRPAATAPAALTTAVPGAAVVAPASVRRCRKTGKDCRSAFLVVLNQTRISHALPPLVLSQRQSDGAGTCAGSRGHSRAMARTGRVWHVDARYASSSFPRDICVPAPSAIEIDRKAPGRPWVALQLINDRILRAGSADQAYRGLLSRSFRHAGLGLTHHRGVEYVTVDLLP